MAAALAARRPGVEGVCRRADQSPSTMTRTRPTSGSTAIAPWSYRGREPLPVVREFDDWRRLAPGGRGRVATGSRRSSPTKAARLLTDDWHAVGSHRGWRGQAELYDLAGEG